VLISLRGYEDARQNVELGPAEARDVGVDLVPQNTTAARVATQAPPRDRREPKAAPAAVSPLTWAFFGAGAAALAGALAFEMSRKSAEDDARISNQVAYPEAVGNMENRRDVARALAVTGGALGLTGAALLVIDLKGSSRERKSTVRLGCSGERCGVLGSGVF
jgi:hypothetical protein